MRIKGPYHDYYDVVQAEGQDQELVYVRIPKEIILPPIRICLFNHSDRYFERYTPYIPGVLVSFEGAAVGFCGKIYPLIKIHFPQDCKEDKHSCCYDLEQVDRFFEEHLSKDTLDRYYYETSAKPRRHKHQTLHRKSIKRYFEEVRPVTDKNLDFFIQNRCPSFVYQYAVRKWHQNGYDNHSSVPILTFNAPLREWEFYRVMNPYTAFQEIQMFLSGLASPEKVIPEIDDKTMRDIKGFDKWSFRKEPTKNRKQETNG